MSEIFWRVSTPSSPDSPAFNVSAVEQPEPLNRLAKLKQWAFRDGWLVALLVLVFFGRLWGLAHYSLDWDECNELAIAKLPVLELIRVIYIRDIHPPGAHLLTHFWIKLLGDSDFTVRLLYALYGLVGLWGTYILARLVNAPRKLAVYTLLLGIFCPFVWHYTHLASHHALFYATMVFSWVFLLRMLKLAQLSVRSADCWGYVLVTLLCLYVQTITPVLLLSQVVFLVWRHRENVCRQWRAWALIAGIFALCYLPQAWAISQPWHPSKMKEMGTGVHNRPTWPALLFMPVQLFWYGDDRAFMSYVPPPEQLLFYCGLGSFLLLYGFRVLRRELPGVWPVLICMTDLPLLILFLVSSILGVHVFQARAILYAAFPMLLAMACWVWQVEYKHGWKPAWFLLGSLIAVQAWTDLNLIELPLDKKSGDFKNIVHFMRPYLHPSDGFLITPGYMSLGVMRYLAPAQFGLTHSELYMNPARENLFHLVQRVEGSYFYVSGDDIRQRPDVQQAFRDFQRAHPRIWYMGELPDYNDQFDCRTIFLVRGPDKRYWQVRCSFLSPQHCRAPLTGSDANHWQCNADILRAQSKSRASTRALTKVAPKGLR